MESTRPNNMPTEIRISEDANYSSENTLEVANRLDEMANGLGSPLAELMRAMVMNSETCYVAATKLHKIVVGMDDWEVWLIIPDPLFELCPIRNIYRLCDYLQGSLKLLPFYHDPFDSRDQCIQGYFQK